MQAFRKRLMAINSTGNASVTIDLGTKRHFLAWATVTMIDSLSNFDRDNAVVADIYTVDGNKLPWQVSGGDHWGSSGSGQNVYPGAWKGYGQKINIWLRVFHMADLEAYGEAIVIVLD